MPHIMSANKARTGDNSEKDIIPSYVVASRALDNDNAERNDEEQTIDIVSHKCFKGDIAQCVTITVPWGTTIGPDDFVRAQDLHCIWEPQACQEVHKQLKSTRDRIQDTNLDAQNSGGVITVKLSSTHRHEGGKIRVIKHQCFQRDKHGCSFDDVPYGSTISGDDFVRFIDLEPLWNPTMKVDDARDKSSLAAGYKTSSTAVTSNLQKREDYGRVEHHDCPDCPDYCKHGLDDPRHYICRPGCLMCKHDKRRGLDGLPINYNEKVEDIPRSNPSSVDEPDVRDEIDHPASFSVSRGIEKRHDDPDIGDEINQPVSVSVSGGIEERDGDICRPCRVWCASTYLELIESGVDRSRQEMYCPPLCFTCSLFGHKAKRVEDIPKLPSVDEPDVSDEIENPVSLALVQRQLPGTPAVHLGPYAQQQYMLAANETHHDDEIQGQSIGMQIAMVCVGALTAMGLFLTITKIWKCCQDERRTRREMREMLP